MKRRDFLRKSLAFGSGSLLFSQLPFRAFATAEMLPLLNCPDINDRILVTVFLKGGNDGVNTLIPISQYDTYSQYRPGIRISDTGTNSFIPLDNTMPLADQIGLHPAMTAFKSMYDDAKVRVLQGVGYPNINGSHFKSTDLWMAGGDGTPANFNLDGGWMGRFLDTVFPGLYGTPIAEYQDPLGIQLGDRKPALSYYNHGGSFVAANLSQQEPGGLYDSIQGIGAAPHDNVPATEFGSQLDYIMQVENSTNVYAQRIQDVFNSGVNSSVVYPQTDLGNQLKTVAKLISGGCKTKVYMVHIDGFDTHAAQADSGSPHLGRHTELLSELCDAIKAFHDDLSILGHEQKVLTATFSEFGRQVIENGSLGTDHGTLGPMFLFGSSVEPGVSGTNVDLLDINNAGKPNESQMQYDYRAVFRTLIQNWLGASDTVVASTLFGAHALIPSLVNTNYVVDPTCYVDTYIPQIQLRAKVFLEGFYDTTLGEMHTELRNQGLLPTTQPFNQAPFNYEGTETVQVMAPDITDWVLTELRDASDINIVVKKQAGLLRSNGDLMDISGLQGITYRNVNAGNYHLVIYHRNHIAVASSVSIDSNGGAIYDFTTSASSALGVGQLKDLGGGVFGMFAGDFDANGKNDVADSALWEANPAKIGGYTNIDGDGNGVVNVQDYNLWKRNQTQTGDPLIQQ